MKFRATTQGLGGLSKIAGRGFFLFLAVFLLFQLIGQPELDDQHPVVGARLLSAKFFKQDQPLKSGMTHLLAPILTAGSGLFAIEFYLTFVRVSRQVDSFHSRLVSLLSSRAPPSGVAS